MKANAKKLLFVMTITAALIFSICLAGCSNSFFDIDIEVDQGEKVGYKRYAIGILTTFTSGDSEDTLGCSVAFVPCKCGTDYTLYVNLLNTREKDDTIEIDYLFALYDFPEEDNDTPYFNMYYGSYNDENGLTETHQQYYDGENSNETTTNASVTRSYFLKVVDYFEILFGDFANTESLDK